MHIMTDKNIFFNGNNGSTTKEVNILNFTSTRFYVTDDGLKPMNSEEATYVRFLERII